MNGGAADPSGVSNPFLFVGACPSEGCTAFRGGSSVREMKERVGNHVIANHRPDETGGGP